MAISTHTETFPGGGLLRLDDRRDFAPRVKANLAGMLSLAGSALQRSLSVMLDEFERQLVRMADKAESNEQQNRYFDTLHEVRRRRVEFAPRYLGMLENALARFDQARQMRGEVEATPVRRSLSLVDSDAVDNTIVLDEVATKAAVRCSHSLYALGHRVGVLAGSPRIDVEVLALGPASLVEALRYAAEPMRLSVDHRALLYRAFERIVMSDASSLYNVLNQYLIDAKILPNLHALPAIVGQVSTRTAKASEVATGAPARAVESLRERPAPETKAPIVLREVAAPRGIDAPANESFLALRDLLKRQRQSRLHFVSRTTLQAALAQLQASPRATSNLRLRGPHRLKHLLLAQLRRQFPGSPMRLRDEDADIIDFVGLMFERLISETVSDGVTHPVLIKLHVPFVRIAMQDQSFLSDRQHPARQLLNAVVDACRYGVDELEGEVDFALSGQIHVIVERIVRDYDGRIELIEELLVELSKYMAGQARKAEAAERRNIAAASGREKLQFATSQARAAIAARLAGRKPGRLLKTLIECAWIDALALTVLRDGIDSASYRRRLAVVDELLVVDGATRDMPPQLSADDLRHELETGLAQIGYHDGDIPSLAQKLLLPDEATTEENPSSQTEIAMKLRSRARLGAENGGAMPEVARVAGEEDAAQLSPEETKRLAEVRALTPGTWFEFDHGAHGMKARRKLAWSSTESERCVFTNVRGAIVAEQTLSLLARELHGARVRLLDAVEAAPVDAAWAAVLAELRREAGDSAA